jgi:hypothetical protein
MGQFLRDRRLGRRRADRVAVRGGDLDCAKADPSIARRLGRVWHADHRSFRPTITAPAVLWGLVGFCGFVYAVIVLWRMRRQGAYEPEFEDWLFHIALPMAAYAALTVSAFVTVFLTHEALFAVGAAALLLLFVGIHNAWDAVFYHVFSSKSGSDPRC